MCMGILNTYMDNGLYVQSVDVWVYNGLVMPIYLELLLSTLYTATFTGERERQKK